VLAIDVSDPRDGFPIATYFLTPRSKLRATDFAPGRFYDFCDAPRDGDTDRVKAFLPGADPNIGASIENGYTPIYFARDPKMVDLLIAHGAKLNIRADRYRNRPTDHRIAFRRRFKVPKWAAVGKMTAGGG
jgi:hypothetical protein